MIDERATMDLDTLIERIVERVLDRLESDAGLRQRALRVREAKLADLKAFEDFYDLPQSILTWKDRHPNSNGGAERTKRK